MNNPAAEQLKQEIVEIRALRLFENKPLIIAAKLSDGKTFTTADWKGKVVLIDFWATWCPPCVAEMPRVKKIYDEYHDKGLEVLGISSDKELDAMKEFVSQNQIAWPQVQDVNPGEADGGPIKDGFGIHGIPVMFLIDKKGILRTVEARDNMDELIPKLLAE